MRRSILYSVLDQAALSAFNFALAFALIRIWSDNPEVFGVYSMVFAGSLALISVQNALINAQFTILRPKATSESDESTLLSMFWTVNVAVVICAMLLMFASILATGSDLALAASAAAYVGATLLREYTRSHHFSDMNVLAVLALDGVSLAISIGLFAAAYAFGPPLGLPILFAILAAGLLIASGLAIRMHRQHYRILADRETVAFYRAVWRKHSFWALMGVLTSEFQQRGYVFVVAAAFGAGSVALIQAAALLFRPIQLVTHAWGKLARAVLADHLARGDVARARAFTLQSFAVLGALFLAFSAALALGWPFISDVLFRGRYTDLGAIVVLWGIAAAVIMSTGIFSLEVQTLMRFRELSFGAALGALVCAVVLAAVVLFGDFRASVLAVIGGQLAFFAVVLCLLPKTKPRFAAKIGPAPELRTKGAPPSSLERGVAEP
ncbi:lipopolysaccharide biosynthesis protein [Rhodomicrobium sp.]|uniref:lipopolysaccharide biosynthesis protein n=1 Tax=Rhodomicrobium sp. TaxID=2720632 RepID=UPI0039E4ED4B